MLVQDNQLVETLASMPRCWLKGFSDWLKTIPPSPRVTFRANLGRHLRQSL
jgi:hypothetical protein